VADSVLSCKEDFGSACRGLPTNDKRAGKLYCVLHSPRGNKDPAAFEGAIEKKLKEEDFDFRGVYFPGKQSLASFLPNYTFEGTVDFSDATFKQEAHFSGATFEGEASFSNATFEGWPQFFDATFKKWANFSNATFKKGAHFSNATFEGWSQFSDATFEGETDFSNATFKKGAHFSSATFEGEASFSYATFVERAISFFKATFNETAIFSYATFEGPVDFFNATFEGKAIFSSALFKKMATFSSAHFKEKGSFLYLRTSSQTRLSFGSAVIEKPESFSFHSTHLRPSWFIDVDAQKFDFSDVEWFRLPDGDELKLEEEIETLEALKGGYRGVPTPSHLRKLQKACRKLMDNAEENRDYSTANEFHYWSMELLRKESWRRLGLVGTLYWLLSGYGERPRRAFLVLAGMGTLFAIFYALVAGSIEHVGQAFLYSLAAMVRLTGVPAMAPLTKLLQPSQPGLFQFLVTAEGILGPLQIALLALAVRRRVMR
jgi:uncharacterized protein YjbI with pentapeptide repeats